MKIVCYLVVVLSFVAVTVLCQNVTCNDTVCRPPNCRCFSTDVPGGFNANEIPQIVLLAFEGAVTIRNYLDIYEPLLFNRINPNGCKIKTTFFNTHEYTNYSIINDLYNRGFEIAVNSITKRVGQDFWLDADSETWYKEQIGMRNMLDIYANIPADQVVGSRAPFLLQGGNEMFQALSENNIRWDSSWTTSAFIDPGLWPYTLDYPSDQDCPVGRCPTESFPGTWVVPMIDLIDNLGNPCATLDNCVIGTTNTSVFNFLLTNFNVHYNGNRSPYGLYLGPGWLLNQANFQGYSMFLEEMYKYDDVYFVSMSQLIDWVQRPTKTSDIPNFGPWNCLDPITPQRCDPVYCAYEPSLTPNGDTERVMSICNRSCPPYYPWYENEDGSIPWRTTTSSSATSVAN